MTSFLLFLIIISVPTSELDIWIPQPFHVEVPTEWWTSEADKSLLVGVFKHGESALVSPTFSHTLKFKDCQRWPSLLFLDGRIVCAKLL